MPVTLAPMWKCTGSSRPEQASQNGSQARWARSGAPRSCGSDVMLTPRAPSPADPLRLPHALVHVPGRHERQGQEAVARVGLDLGHRVVVDLDGEPAQGGVVGCSEVLATEPDRAGEDDLRVDAALVEHAEADLGIPRTEVDVVVGPLEERAVCALLGTVPPDDAARAEASDRMAVEDPHRLPVDLLDPRDPVPEGGGRPLGEEVGRLAPVRVGVDDEHVVQH